MRGASASTSSPAASPTLRTRTSLRMWSSSRSITPPPLGGVAAATTAGAILAKAAPSAASGRGARVGERLQRRQFAARRPPGAPAPPIPGANGAPAFRRSFKRNGEDRRRRPVATGRDLRRGDARLALGRGERAFNLGEAIVERAEIGVGGLQRRQFAFQFADARLQRARRRTGRARRPGPARAAARCRSGRERQSLGGVGARGARFLQRRLSALRFAGRRLRARPRGAPSASSAAAFAAPASLASSATRRLSKLALACDWPSAPRSSAARREVAALERGGARIDEPRRAERERRAEQRAERARDEGEAGRARSRPDFRRVRPAAGFGGRLLRCAGVRRPPPRAPAAAARRISVASPSITPGSWRGSRLGGAAPRRRARRFRVRIFGSRRRPWGLALASRFSIGEPPRDENPRGVAGRAAPSNLQRSGGQRALERVDEPVFPRFRGAKRGAARPRRAAVRRRRGKGRHGESREKGRRGPPARPAPRPARRSGANSAGPRRIPPPRAPRLRSRRRAPRRRRLPPAS